MIYYGYFGNILFTNLDSEINILLLTLSDTLEDQEVGLNGWKTSSKTEEKIFDLVVHNLI